MKLVYPACFYPCEEGGYTVTFQDLPGCVTQGSDLEHAIEMAIDAASGWVLDEIEEGMPIPYASKYDDIKLKYGDGFISLIMIDIDRYAEKYGIKSIRKNLTIPAWLNTIAEKKQVNFSELLQNALIEHLHVSEKSEVYRK